MRSRIALALGALLAAIGVGLGAFGAHGLEDWLLQLGYEAELQQRIDWFETGVKYHLFHALAIVVVALLPKSKVPGIAFLCGIFLFCGSLYAMTFLPPEWKKLGAVVPLGGLSFISGWVALAVSALRDKPEDSAS